MLLSLPLKEKSRLALKPSWREGETLLGLPGRVKKCKGRESCEDANVGDAGGEVEALTLVPDKKRPDGFLEGRRAENAF